MEMHIYKMNIQSNDLPGISSTFECENIARFWRSKHLLTGIIFFKSIIHRYYKLYYEKAWIFLISLAVEIFSGIVMKFSFICLNLCHWSVVSDYNRPMSHPVSYVWSNVCDVFIILSVHSLNIYLVVFNYYYFINNACTMAMCNGQYVYMYIWSS